MGLFGIGKPNIEKLKVKKDVEGLIKALKHKDRDIREKAAKALGKIKGERAVETLIQALKDEGTWVRQEAAKALGKIKDKRAVRPLIQVLKDCRYEDAGGVAEEAAEALGKIKDKRAVEPLVHAALHDSEDVRKDAVKALTNIERERAVMLFIEALEDEDYEVGCNAAEALGNIKDERSVEPLIRAARLTHVAVRKKAAEALSKVMDMPMDKELQLKIARSIDGATKAAQEAEHLVGRLIDELVEIGRSEGFLILSTNYEECNDCGSRVKITRNKRKCPECGLVQNYSHFEKSGKNKRARRIGTTLNEMGGMELMQKSCKEVWTELGASHGRMLEAAWGHIGSWLP